jgi:hypothetical protein
MKRLEINNFTKRVMEIHSDFFEIKHCSNEGDKYLIGLDVRDVVSFKPLKPKYYKIAIHKRLESGDYGYHVWIWDIEDNISYPMTIDSIELKSTSTFTSFLNRIVGILDEGGFSGSTGNKITL